MNSLWTAAVLIAILTLALCDDAMTYTNPLKLPNDELGAGIADPGVIRWMGKYYLYSTKVVEDRGIKCWESADLVNWTFKGYCTGEDPAFGNRMAWNPGTLYYNGKFYLYVCSDDQKHRVLQADQPWGPFTCVNDNLLDVKSLDAEPFLDDDGQLYLFYAGWGGIQYRKCSSPVKADGENHQLKACVFSAIKDNLWVEGPMILKREGIYYLSYCGNDWIKDNYQVQTAKGKVFKDLNPQKSNPLLTETSGPWVATGCNYIVLGPDLRSIWNVYHCRKAGGHARRLCLDRLYIDPKTMDLRSDGPTWTETPAPRLPTWFEDFKRRDLGTSWEVCSGTWDIHEMQYVRTGSSTQSEMLCRNATKDDFAAEFNLRLAAPGPLDGKQDFGVILCRKGRSGFYLVLDVKSKSLELWETSSGKRSGSALMRADIPQDFDLDVWHTIRIDKTSDRLLVYFDNMLKIDRQITAGGGRFGFAANNCSADFGWCGYTH